MDAVFPATDLLSESEAFCMTMMGAALILLCVLLSQVNGITTAAKCLSGNEWMFSSIGQSPCDIAAELAAVCTGRFNLAPLDAGYMYSGPFQDVQNSCRCSSVYYSLLSACAHCQGRNYHRWSDYNINCTTVYVTVYNQQIPVGVKVPVYAYQNVSILDTFDVTLAYRTKGVESSRLPPSSTATSASDSNNSTSKHTHAIVGGVVGGVTGLCVLVLITCLLLRKRKQKLQADTQSLQPNSIMPNTTPSFLHMVPGPPGSPGSSEDPNDLSKYSPSMSSPYREHSPPFRILTMTPNDTGVSAPNSVLPQIMPQNSGGRSY